MFEIGDLKPFGSCIRCNTAQLYDHLISLQLGGDPNDPRNLWVEPPDPGHKKGGGVNNAKDPVETKLHTAVCSGKVTLGAAQKAIVTDWTTALSTLGLG